MSEFQIKTASDVKQDEDIVYGANKYTPLESGIYQATIDVAYLTISKKGAQGLVVKYSVEREGEDPQKLTHTNWVTKRTGENFYIDSKNQKRTLMGFNVANDLTTLLLKQSLAEIDFEERKIEVKKGTFEVVPVAYGLSGKKVAICVQKVRSNATEQVGEEYIPTNQERFSNDVVKVLNSEGFTNLEVKNGLDEPKFAMNWADQWNGEINDKFKQIASTSTNNSKVKTGTLNIG